MRLARVGKIPTTAVRRLISLLSRSWGVSRFGCYTIIWDVTIAGRSQGSRLGLASRHIFRQTAARREPHLRFLVDVYALAAPPFGGWGLTRHT